MSYESSAEPIRFGYLFDFRLPEGFPEVMRGDLTQPFELVFRRGREQGLIDRPVEIIFREVEGLPKGAIRHVIKAYEELVDEGCLAIFGPSITDNCEPLREEIENRFKVPAISVTGSEGWLGEWTFSLPQGSMTEEPIFWTRLLEARGLHNVGMVVEQSLIGTSYLNSFHDACRRSSVRVVAEELIPQTAQNIDAVVDRLHAAGVDALVHCGFGFGLVQINAALRRLNWDPPRFTGTAFQNAWINARIWNAFEGWTGVDQYDEGNLVGQAFLDDYEKEYGRRPEYCVPVMNRDLATVLLHAFADARPLTPRGVRDALEKVKMIPAAGGAPGTQLSFGKWVHRGWMGSSYLVARQLDPDGINSHLVARFGQEMS